MLRTLKFIRITGAFLLGGLLSSCSKQAPAPRSAAPETKNPSPPVTTNAAAHSHTNRLAREKSPYLRQHMHNPVDWYAWGEEAFAKARAENKPIFLSIGYSTCHWCHVMERESFEDTATAQLMNEHFVSIKVDREERPDVDAICMEAVQAITGQGGWPLNVFLTPEQQPIHGGTYFPPQPRQGLPSWRMVLEAVAEAWRERSGEIREQLSDVAGRLSGASRLTPADAVPGPEL
ncbi:MAG: thioredoxin domain-containing protein, partial [Verrucomicrobia bacterium]|nr:thioredoxin domain-containing protein [Verrucomicrobiota bacterium]